MDSIRLLAEKSDRVEGFIITHSAGGGTGSGFSSRILETLDQDFSQAIRIPVTVFPSGSSGPL